VGRNGEGRVVGAVGLEIHGEDGLLRSLVVDPEVRGGGLGLRLVDALEAAAADRGLTNLYLLTTTAARFFPKLGYAVGLRAEVPAAVAGSREFQALCPDSAVMLRKRLNHDGPA